MKNFVERVKSVRKKPHTVNGATINQLDRIIPKLVGYQAELFDL